MHLDEINRNDIYGTSGESIKIVVGIWSQIHYAATPTHFEGNGSVLTVKTGNSGRVKMEVNGSKWRKVHVVINLSKCMFHRGIWRKSSEKCWVVPFN